MPEQRILEDDETIVKASEWQELATKLAKAENDLAVLKSNMETNYVSKHRVREETIEAAKEHDLCKTGVNQFLVTLGLERWNQLFEVEVQLTATFRIEENTQTEAERLVKYAINEITFDSNIEQISDLDKNVVSAIEL